MGRGNTDERDLVRRLRRGDRVALDAFTAQYLDRLYQFVYYRVSANQQVAEDLTQESLLAALDGLERFDGRAVLDTWLCSIARHKVADYFRRLQRFEQVRAALVLDAGASAEPADAVQRDERRRRILAVLRSLPPHYQRVLILKYLDGLSGRELAGALQLSEDAAESLLARARRAFQRLFEQQRENPEASATNELC